VTKIPRDVSAARLVKALAVLGYVLTRQKGSHIRLTTQMGGEHYEVIPNHDPIKIGTFHDILNSIAQHHHISLEELLRQIDLS
jgi:predicted RNA binding protein YcfA (HicA-like mRNA interferase family)